MIEAYWAELLCTYTLLLSFLFVLSFATTFPQHKSVSLDLKLTFIMHSLFGFLLGSTLAGAGSYYYVLDEYRVANEMLTEDIYVRLCI